MTDISLSSTREASPIRARSLTAHNHYFTPSQHRHIILATPSQRTHPPCHTLTIATHLPTQHTYPRNLRRLVQVATYFMGAYLFESSPPFAITHMSTEPISSPSFYNASLPWAYKTMDYIVFPTSFEYTPDGTGIYLAYGFQGNSPSHTSSSHHPRHTFSHNAITHCLTHL